MKNKLFERITRFFAPPTRFLAAIFALAAICATTGAAWADTTTSITAPSSWGGTKPAAVWCGDFPATGNDSPRNGYTLNLNGNATTDGIVTIGGSSSTGGVTVKTTTGKTAVGVVAGIKGVASSSAIRILMSSYQTDSNDNRTMVGFKANESKFSGFTSGPTYFNSNDKSWTSNANTNYFAFYYQGTSGTGRGTYAYLNGSDTIYNNAGTLAYGDSSVLGVTFGGAHGTKDYNMDGAVISYAAVLDATSATDLSSVLKYWSLTDISSIEVHKTAGNIEGGTGRGITLDLSGGTVTVSGVKTAAAVFVQSNTTLDFSADSTSRLAISGPLYIATGATLTIKLGTLSNGYRRPITMGSCFASNNQIAVEYATPAGSTTSILPKADSITAFTQDDTPAAVSISDYTPWSYANDVFTWISPSDATGNDVALWKYIKFDVTTGQDAAGATAIEGGENTAYDTAATPSKKFWWYWCYSGDSSYPGYRAPGLVARFLPDDSENTYLKTISAGFGPLTLGGLIVEDEATGYKFVNDTGVRWTTLGDPTGATETRFTILEDFAINRNGSMNLVGTTHFDIAAGKVLSLNASRADDQQPVLRATVGAAANNGEITTGITSGGSLKMHGEGLLEAKKLTASGACLDYSALSTSRTVPYIDAQLVVDSSTYYKFPALSGVTSYQLATKVAVDGSITGEQTFEIGGHEYKAPLTFNAAAGTVVFPYVATVNGSGSEVVWSAISWDARPVAAPSSSDVVTLNIAGNTTLDFDEALSVDKLVLNIAEGAELTLKTLSNLTTANGIVLRGAGALRIDAATTIAQSITVDDDVTILLSGDTAALTVSGTLTVNTGKTLYIGAENWTTPALGGIRNVISATTLTNNGTIATGAVSGDAGRTYTASVSGNNVSVMRMTSEAFAYNTYPDGGAATGWATSWDEGFDANQLRVGPSETYKYAYYTTSDKQPYKSSLNGRGDSLSLSIYADLSQTPSSGKAVIVGFGGAGTANNKLLMLYREENTVKWAVVDRGPDNGTTAVLGSAASVTLPSGGYHLYTGTFDKTTGNLQLFLDGAAAVNGTSAANTTIASGMHIGNAFQGVGQFKGSHGFVMGTNAAIVAMRGYNVVLDSAEVGVLAGRYPASTGAIDRDIQLDLSGKTLTVYGSTESTATTMGPGEGTMVIAADNTVKVTNFRTYPYQNLTGGATAATIAGKLEVTAEDNDSIAAEKGVVLGYYLSASSGARTTEATVPSEGEIDAAKAYIMMPWAENVASATLNISGGTVKVKGLMSHQANKGTVYLTDGGVLEVGEILATGQAIVKNFGYGTFRVKANAEETRAVNFNAETLSQPTTLDPDGHTLTMAADAMTGSGAVKVGGSNGGTVTFSGFTSAFTGTIIIDDSNVSMMSVTSWSNFSGTIYYNATTEELDLRSYDMPNATINVGPGATVKLNAGGATVNVVYSGTAKLYVSEDVYKYDGFIYKGSSAGTVEYYQGDTPTLVTSEYMNGNNLLPYYSIFQGHADGDNYVGNLNTASDWKNGTDAGFAVPTSRNAAIYVPDGKTLTVTIDNTCSFGEVQIYTDPTATIGGTVIFKKGESGSMTVTSVICVTDKTAMQIDDEGVVFSGSEINLASGATAIFNATSFSAPKITGSGTVQVNADKAVTFTDNANVTAANISGTATISSGKTLTASTLNVAGTGVVNVSASTASLSVTTATGTGTINWVGKKPDGTVWTGNEWSGTNVVSSAEAEEIRSLDPENWGRNGSYIVMKNLKGYIDTNGGTINAEVIFEDGTQGYALNISNGYNGRNTYFRKISGSGTIKDGKLSTGAVQQFIFQDANEFTGSITPAGDNASDSYYTKRFVFASSGYDTDGYGTYFGTLRVLSNGAAKVGAGKTWKANTGISIAGTVTFCGGAAAARMASPTTFTHGATLVFQDGASLSFEAASSPVTLPASGTVNIDASAMTLTSSGATILTSTVAFTSDDVAKLKSVGHHVFALDGTDAKKINVYPAVAKVGDTYYTDLATAEAAVSESSPFIEVYDGTPAGTYNTFSTGEGVTTYRKTNLNVYYQSGKYWSSTTEGLFKLEDGTDTPAYAGDTIVIDSKSAGDIWADPANPVAATAISVERGVTFKQGEGTGNLFDGKTFTVADDVTLTISGLTRAVTLGAVTFNKATSTGAVALDGSTNGITLNGNLSGTAPITVVGTVTLSTGNELDGVASLKGSGTIVLPAGTAPSSSLATLLSNSNWQGTVVVTGYSNTTGNIPMNTWGNSGSKIKLIGVSGGMNNLHTENEISAEVILENGSYSHGFDIAENFNSEVTQVTFAKISGSGTLKVSYSGNCTKVYEIKNADDFTGNVVQTSNGTAARVYFSKARSGGFVDATNDAMGGVNVNGQAGFITVDGNGNDDLTLPLANGTAWTAGKWGFVVNGNVEVKGSATWNGAVRCNILSSSDTTSNAKKARFIFDDLGTSDSPKYLTISSLTYIDSAVPVKIAFNGATLRVDAKLIGWSSKTATGSFEFDDGTDNKVESGVRYVLASEDDGLYLREAVAKATTAGDVVSYHASVADAVSAAGAGGTITVLALQGTVTVNLDQNVIVADGVTVGGISWGAEYASQGAIASGDGTTVYSCTGNAPTSYYWTGTSGAAWSSASNWKVGSSSGATATRTPTTGDTANLGEGAVVSLTAAVPGLSSLIGDVSSKITANSFDFADNIKNQLKNANWKGTLTFSGITLTSGSGTDLSNYGNASSTVELDNCTLWYFTAFTFDGTLKVTNTVTVSNGGSSTETKFGALTGSGTLVTGLKSDGVTTYPPRQMLKFGTAEEFTGSFDIRYAADSGNGHTYSGMRIVIGTSQEGNANGANEKNTTPFIIIDANCTAQLGDGSSWTAIKGIFVNGTLKVAGSGTFASATTFGDGSTVKFYSLNTTTFALTTSSGVVVAAGDTVKVALDSGVTLAAGQKLISWSSKPAGAFTFDDGEGAKEVGGNYYILSSEDDGLYVRRLEPTLPFSTNVENVTVTMPAEANYTVSGSSVTSVGIVSAPIMLTDLAINDRLAPFTFAASVTLPATIPTGYNPVLVSWNVGQYRIDIVRDTTGYLEATTGNDTIWSTTTGNDPNNKATAHNSVTLAPGSTCDIVIRFWGAQHVNDTDNPNKTRGYSADNNSGTTVWINGTEVLHSPGLRWGSNTTPGEATPFVSKIAIGGAATDAATYVFTDLKVNSAGFINERGMLYDVPQAETYKLFSDSDVTVTPVAALPGMTTAANYDAEYYYSYGVAPLCGDGGYKLTSQTHVSHNTTTTVDYECYTRGVIMSHDQTGEGNVTVTMSVNIPSGSTGGTVCEIPLSDGAVTVTYDGATDKFALNGIAQSSALSIADGEHTLKIVYDSGAGAYLWVDDLAEASCAVANACVNGKEIGDKIYFGSGAATTSGNGFFANLGVESQNVAFAAASSVSDTVLAEAVEGVTFDPELASIPLVERVKYMANANPGDTTVSVPTITIGTGASAKVLTGYAALSAAREMGVYQDYTTTLEMDSFDSASKVMTCAVDPSFNGKMSVSLAGSTNRLVWTRLEVATDLSSGSVSLPLSTHAFGNGGDYRWFNIIEEAYTNGVPVETGRIHTKLADRPTTDRIFKFGEEGWNHDVYRIPAMAATPDGQTVMGIFDARYCYQDLGVPLDANGNGAGPYNAPNHYTGIDIAGVFSLDAGENWSYPEVMIDVPNASDPQTGVKVTSLTASMELGDSSIVYDPMSEKFIMMGITGGGLTTVHNGQSDVVTYECSLASVQNGAPNWTNRTSVKSQIEAALQSAGSFTIPAYKTGWYDNGYLGILQGPGHAFVTRYPCGDIPANTVVWPMQYVVREAGVLKGGDFAAWKDGGGTWRTTKLVPNDNYVTQEGCITQLDNGYLLYMCKIVPSGTARPFYVSSDGLNWTYLNEISGLASGSMCQGSMLRIGAGTDGHSRYAAVCATGTLRSAIKVYIATDNGSGGVTWGAQPFETVWAEETGTANDGVGAHGDLVYGYNSLVMLNPTTLGVLFEANGHIYFTKVDVAGALQ